MMRAVMLAGFLVLAMTLSACSAGENSPPPAIVCTTQMVPSVVVHVSDSVGAPITGADVQYSVNGSAFAPAESSYNGLYDLAYETTGNFVVRVTVGAKPLQEKSTTVVRDGVGCHVITHDLFYIFQ